MVGGVGVAGGLSGGWWPARCAGGHDLIPWKPSFGAYLAAYLAAAPVQLPPILSAVAVLHCNSELMQAVFVPSCQMPCRACEPPILACGSRRHDAAHRYRSVPPVARHKKPGTLAGSVVGGRSDHGCRLEHRAARAAVIRQSVQRVVGAVGRWLVCPDCAVTRISPARCRPVSASPACRWCGC